MKAISQKPSDLWQEVERALAEHTASGYKMACIEAEKVFYHVLREKGYPTGNIKQVLALFGWKLTSKDSLRQALEKSNQIKTTFEYTLSSFEAEDIVQAYKQAVNDFGKANTLSWKRRLTVFWDNYISYKSSFAKMALLSIFVFFLAVKFLSSTAVGEQMVRWAVAASDFVFSWLLLLLGVGALVIIVIFVAVTYYEKRHSKVRVIK